MAKPANWKADPYKQSLIDAVLQNESLKQKIANYLAKRYKYNQNKNKGAKSSNNEKGSNNKNYLKKLFTELYKNSNIFVVTCFAGGVKPTLVFRIL